MGVPRWRSISEADRHPPTCATPTRRWHRAGAGGPELSRVERHPGGCRADRRRAIHPGYGFLQRERRVCGACAAHSTALHRPTPDQMRALGMTHRAPMAEQRACRSCRAPSCSDVVEAGAEPRAHRISGDAQEHGWRRGHRAARVSRPGELRRGLRGRGAPESQQLRRPACSWRSSCRRRATSRCRSSATAAAACWRWASATAPRSAATRR